MDMLCNGNLIKRREETKISFIKSCKYDHKNGNKKIGDVFIGLLHIQIQFGY
ncbi:MAG: hypothetical protein IPP49_07315 [Saprospiraceae bacterium]|nr:hypothetical protein [Saprospiraceae bacterium]